MEGLWDKYASSLTHIIEQREHVATHLADVLKALGYAR